MTHSEKRTDWRKEFACAFITGNLYGGTNTIVGHPFDTVKTKMQVQSGHMGLRVGYIDSIKNVYN